MNNFWIRRRYSRLVRWLQEWNLVEVLPELRRVFDNEEIDWDSCEDALHSGAVITDINITMLTDGLPCLVVRLASFDEILDNLLLDVVVDLELEDDGRLRVERAPFKWSAEA